MITFQSRNTDLINFRTISSRRHEALLEEHDALSKIHTQLLEKTSRVSQQVSNTGTTSVNEFRSIREVHRESRFVGPF